MAEDGIIEERTTAESPTEPDPHVKPEAEAAAAAAERDKAAEGTPAPSAPDSAEQVTAAVAAPAAAQPSPREQDHGVNGDAPRQDSSPSIELHGDVDGEPLGLTEPQPEPGVNEPKPSPEPTVAPTPTAAPAEQQAKPEPSPEPTVAPSPAPAEQQTKPKPSEPRPPKPSREPIVAPSPTAVVEPVSQAQPGAARGRMGRFERSVVVTVLLGIALAALVALALPRKALLVVTATGPRDQNLQHLEITVDGELKCDKSPCTVGELGAGEHTIRLSSDEVGVAERVLTMRSGADHSLAFVLEKRGRDIALAERPPSAATPAEPSAETPSELQDRGATPVARGKSRGHGTGTIKANSIPVSDVLVDGRIQGKTPANISAAPGLHTVVFIHPDYGRREVVVQVKPNQDAVAAVRFRRSTP
jgi:hypothetical protein